MTTVISEPQIVSRSPRSILREWLQTIAGTGDEYDVAELTSRAIKRFEDDPEMLAASVSMTVRDLLPQVAGQTFRQWREDSRENFEDEVARKLGRWFEHVGGTRHKSLLSLTKSDGLFASEQRRKRAAGELLGAAFVSDLVSLLPDDDTETVRQRYSDEELAAVWRRHYEEKS